MSSHKYNDLLDKINDHNPKDEIDIFSKDLIYGGEKPTEVEAWRHFYWIPFFGVWIISCMCLARGINSLFFGFQLDSIYLWNIIFPICLLIVAVPAWASWVWIRSIMLLTNTTVGDKKDVTRYIEFVNPKSKQRLFGNENLTRKASIQELHDAYFNEEINIKCDLFETLENLHLFSHYQLNWHLIKFFFSNFLPELIIHSRAQDRSQVQDHYNRGNDFFRSFLGKTMIYTSAVFNNANESLELGQYRKLSLVCKKLHLKPGMKHLDLGCGWGTLAAYAARYYGTESIGITLAKEQVDWANDQLKREPFIINNNNDNSDNTNGNGSAEYHVCDYRDINIYAPNNKKFHAISCLEMAEHVGIRKFNSFLKQVYNMLEDDGLFYLQIAGIRRSFYFGDWVWSGFMDKYIFPGADASLPLYRVVDALELVGFEIHSIENVDQHYLLTIYKWYMNWQTNKDYIIKNYGIKWYRIWLWFLAWAVVIGKQGRSTCYQIVCHKNKSEFNRGMFVGERDKCKFYQFPTKSPIPGTDKIQS